MSRRQPADSKGDLARLHVIRDYQRHPDPLPDPRQWSSSPGCSRRAASVGDLALDGAGRQARMEGDGRARGAVAALHLHRLRPARVGPLGRTHRAAHLGYYVEEAKGLLDLAGARQAYVLGSCMGAALALAFAVRHPQACKSLLLHWPVGGYRWMLKGRTFFARHLDFVRANGLAAVVARAAQGENFWLDPEIGPWGSPAAVYPDFAAELLRQNPRDYIEIAERSRDELFNDTMPSGASRCGVDEDRNPLLHPPGQRLFARVFGLARAEGADAERRAVGRAARTGRTGATRWKSSCALRATWKAAPAPLVVGQIEVLFRRGRRPPRPSISARRASMFSNPCGRSARRA